jgi:flagellar motor switch protein FliM
VYPEVAGFEFNPLLIPASDPPEAALLLTYDLTIDGAALGRVSLCYPLSTLQPVGEILRQQEPDEDAVPAAPGPLVGVLPSVKVPLSVRLNPVTLPASDLLALEPGDVIRLSHGIDQPVVAVVDDLPMVEGRIGRLGARVAFEFMNWRTE